MATRAQLVQEAFANCNTDNSQPWYAREDTWELIMQVAGFSVDVLKVFNKPIAANTLDAIRVAMGRKVLTRKDAEVWLKQRLRVISLQLQEVDREQDPITYERYDAQLELIMELLNECKVGNGEE